MKAYDSTVLHFSTTYDHSHSSVTGQDESIDSLDELNMNRDLLSLDTILLPESIVYYNILDLFAVVSERTHEVLSTHFRNTFETEKTIVDENTFLELQSPIQTFKSSATNKRGSDKENEEFNGINFFESDISTFRVGVRGFYLNPAEDGNAKLIKKRSNAFLTTFEKKLFWLINNIDMNNPHFYDMETEQMEILEEYLSENTSKIIVFEVMDSLFEVLLLIKKQIVDLASIYLNTVTTVANTTRIVSPHLTAKGHRTGSISKDIPTPTTTQTISANFLRSVLKPNAFSSSRNPELSPEKKFEDKSKTIVFPAALTFANSFIYKQRGLFLGYLGVISNLILKAPKTDVYNLINDVFVSNDTWSETAKLFTNAIFGEINSLCDKIEESNEISIEKDQIDNFLEAKKLIKYYSTILVMCN